MDVQSPVKKPVLFAVDDEPSVLAAIARDLRRAYGDRYRVLRAGSGQEALQALHELKLRGDAVALLLADQRMPEMSGVAFLGRAIELFPDAKRALLTAYADTDAAIRAINEVRLDHYLMKPWDPPEERLYPVLDDLLDDWSASYRPAFDGLRLVGARWSPATHALKHFLERNLVPYRWFDVEDGAGSRDEALRLLEAAGLSSGPLPVVLLPDGTALAQPDPPSLASAIGLRTEARLPFYDLVIVGGGPAGLAAAVYGASEGLRTVLIEGDAPGGQAGTSASIQNYLGFPSGLSGADLTRRAVAQARRFGAEILTPLRAVGIELRDPYRCVKLSNGTELAGHAVLVATGVLYRRLDAPGTDALEGAGVYYGAAITEAVAARGERVVVVGGGNSAGQAAAYLARFAERVTLVVRAHDLGAGMSRYLVEQLEALPNVDVRTRTTVKGVHGTHGLTSVTLGDRDDGTTSELPASAMFVFIGARPHTDWLEGVVERDAGGFVRTGVDLAPPGKRPAGWTLERAPFWLETSVPGVFAAGDVRHRSIKRIASAVGEGSMAVQFVHQHLAGS